MKDEIMDKSPTSIGSALTWQNKAMIIGGIVGAAVGVTAAYLLAQRAEDDRPPEMSVGDGVKIGVLVLSLLRSIATL